MLVTFYELATKRKKLLTGRTKLVTLIVVYVTKTAQQSRKRMKRSYNVTLIISLIIAIVLLTNG